MPGSNQKSCILKQTIKGLKGLVRIIKVIKNMQLLKLTFFLQQMLGKAHTLEDLECVDPTLFKGLKWML